LQEIISILEAYEHQNQSIYISLTQLREVYTLHKTSICSFCDGIAETNLNDELVKIPLMGLKYILRNCNSLTQHLNSSLYKTDGLIEAALTNELVEIPLIKLEFILLSCDYIKNI
jgi:hypothetical protein